VIWDFQF